MLCIYTYIHFFRLLMLAYTSTDLVAFHCVWDYVCSYLSSEVFALLNTPIIASYLFRVLMLFSYLGFLNFWILELGGMVFIRLLNTFCLNCVHDDLSGFDTITYRICGNFFADYCFFLAMRIRCVLTVDLKYLYWHCFCFKGAAEKHFQTCWRSCRLCGF